MTLENIKSIHVKGGCTCLVVVCSGSVDPMEEFQLFLSEHSNVCVFLLIYKLVHVLWYKDSGHINRHDNHVSDGRPSVEETGRFRAGSEMKQC